MHVQWKVQNTQPSIDRIFSGVCCCYGLANGKMKAKQAGFLGTRKGEVWGSSTDSLGSLATPPACWLAHLADQGSLGFLASPFYAVS